MTSLTKNPKAITIIFLLQTGKLAACFEGMNSSLMIDWRAMELQSGANIEAGFLDTIYLYPDSKRVKIHYPSKGIFY